MKNQAQQDIDDLRRCYAARNRRYRAINRYRHHPTPFGKAAAWLLSVAIMVCVIILTTNLFR